MKNFELKITLKDWFYIILIAAFFGFLISLVFYYFDEKLQTISTIYFSTITAVIISIFSAVFISISNNLILPKVSYQFWYIISFLFSFLSGSLGFFVSYFIFLYFKVEIIYFIKPYLIHISIIIGCLTFLIGLILHKFISMKYKNESFKNEILETKLKALENELNPHFLFNALNSISELIYVDKKKAEESIINVSKFLRNAIYTDSLVTCEHELKMVKTYVDIENIRFENKIVLNFIYLDSNNTKLIPKFSIQLLVENAIKHGFKNEVLNIEIKISKDKIIVSNDGKFEDIVKFGTGLSNLDKRLKLLKIGTLDYQIEKDVKFIIRLNNENTNSR